VTHIIDGTEYLDSREMRIWRGIRILNEQGRTTNSSQVARVTGYSPGIVTQVAGHLKARGFLADVSQNAAYHWRVTDQIPPESVISRTANCEIVSSGQGYYARCGSCPYVSEVATSAGTARTWAEAHDEDQPGDHRA
jgi:hypothetical protein